MRTIAAARHRRLAVWVLLGLMVATVLTQLSGPALAGPTKGTPSPSPQLSIAVDDGRANASRGDTLSYVVTLTNTGTTNVSDLVVTQSVPAGTSLVTTDQHGTRTSGVVQWKVDLKAAKKATFRTTLKLGGTPPDLLRLASVACAKLSVRSAPVVCASDSNLLPAGASAVSDRQPASPAGGRVWWLVGGGVGAAALLTVLLVLVARRRGARADSTPVG